MQPTLNPIVYNELTPQNLSTKCLHTLPPNEINVTVFVCAVHLFPALRLASIFLPHFALSTFCFMLLAIRSSTSKIQSEVNWF